MQTPPLYFCPFLLLTAAIPLVISLSLLTHIIPELPARCYKRRPVVCHRRFSFLSMRHLLTLHIADLSMLSNYNSHISVHCDPYCICNILPCSICSVHIHPSMASPLWVKTAAHCATTFREGCDLCVSDTMQQSMLSCSSPSLSRGSVRTPLSQMLVLLSIFLLLLSKVNLNNLIWIELMSKYLRSDSKLFQRGIVPTPNRLQYVCTLSVLV